MKLLLKALPLVILVFCGSAFAQPDFTRANVFQAGDTFEFLAVNATSADPGPAGNGVTWDFSNLPRLASEDFTTTYDDPSAAPNANLFPEANLVGIQSVGQGQFGYTFFTVSDNRVVFDGLDLPDLGVLTYSDKSEWVDFPFSFNETETDAFVGQYTANIEGVSVIANRTGDLTTTYDGFGTIILPDGTTVNNVRRFKILQTVRDAFEVSGFEVVSTVDTTTYAWWVDGERAPIFDLTFADSTVTPPGVTVNSVVATYRAVDGGGGQEPPVAGKTRLPHLTTQGGNFDTDILVNNATNTSQSVSFDAYSSSGSLLSESSITLDGGFTLRGDQSALAPSASSASAEIEGCEGCVVTAGYRAAVEGASTAHVHQTDRFANEFYFYPGEWNLLFDGAAITNMGDAAATIEAVQIADDGTELGRSLLSDNLAPNAKFLDVFNNRLTDNPNSIVKLESNQPIAVMVLRISTDGRFLYENAPLPEAPSDDRWLAHITSEDGGFDTFIYVHNSAGSTQSVTFHPYNSAGTAQDTFEVSVPGGSTARFAKTEIFDPSTSHTAISGSTSCIVTAGYQARLDDASTAPIHEAAPVGTRFTIYPGEWNLLFDGMALVNTGDGTATITATSFIDTGAEFDSTVLVDGLAPNAKFLGVLEGQLMEAPASRIVIESTQPMAILSLRLSKDARFLYGNAPLPE